MGNHRIIEFNFLNGRVGWTCTLPFLNFAVKIFFKNRYVLLSKCV